MLIYRFSQAEKLKLALVDLQFKSNNKLVNKSTNQFALLLREVT